jgi:4-amino-4-deoxy-L-arabinose transferase-like glycosyltransferase
MLGTLLLVILASGLIIFSAREQSITVDEPNHLYCGMEWLQEGTYTAWPENPPLSRAIVAIGPYLRGFRITPPSFTEGAGVWEHFVASFDMTYLDGGAMQEKLFWLRIFILPFFLLSVWLVWYWTRELGGQAAALLAVGMYCSLPVMLAHSSLATTDVSFVAFFTLLLFCFSRWLKQPTVLRGLVFGLSLGAALLTKYSTLAFFPPAALLMLLLYFIWGPKHQSLLPGQWVRMALKSGALGLLVAFFTIWAFFGFSVGKLGHQPLMKIVLAAGNFPAWQGELMLPAPEWFAGLNLLMFHNQEGHLAFIAGQLVLHGLWFFYPLAFLIKTPLPFLILLLLGTCGAWLSDKKPRNWEVLALSLLPFVLLLSGLSSNINIGLRHMLVLYPLGAIGASLGLMQLVRYQARKPKPQWIKAVPLVLLAWQLVIAGIAYPRYLSYFNPLGGNEPGKFLVDSDLDWGQGMLELEKFCRENQIESLSISYFGLGRECWYDLPALKPLHPDSLAEGWIAVSEFAYRGILRGELLPDPSCQFFSINAAFTEDLQPGQGYRWLDAYPLKARLAGSIRVYYIDKEKGVPAPVLIPASSGLQP